MSYKIWLLGIGFAGNYPEVAATVQRSLFLIAIYREPDAFWRSDEKS